MRTIAGIIAVVCLLLSAGPNYPLLPEEDERTLSLVLERWTRKLPSDGAHFVIAPVTFDFSQRYGKDTAAAYANLKGHILENIRIEGFDLGALVDQFIERDRKQTRMRISPAIKGRVLLDRTDAFPKYFQEGGGGWEKWYKDNPKARGHFAVSVVSCYEAGRDGFWIHRFLAHEGIHNTVVDSASIEVSRRKRRAKSDRLDAVKLVSMLIRWQNGEKDVWKVVHVPTVADEDRRQLHRELSELKSERTELANRIKGLLAGLGLSIVVSDKLPDRLEKLRQWDEACLPGALKARILREFERWQFVSRQINDLDAQRAREIRTDKSPQGEQVRRLMGLKGIGANGAWLLVREFFGWRDS